MSRLFAVDPSLTCSGWAIFASASGELLSVGKITSKGTAYPMAERLADLQERVVELFDKTTISPNDVLICEAPTTMRDPRAALIVEQVRGIFESLARSRGALVPGRVNPRSVQHEVIGLRGKQLKRAVVKDAARDTVFHLFGDRLASLGLNLKASKRSHQDIVDAVLVGTYCISKIQQAKLAGEPLEHVFSQNQWLAHATRRN